jgi:lysophospholipase L1-like esterase
LLVHLTTLAKGSPVQSTQSSFIARIARIARKSTSSWLAVVVASLVACGTTSGGSGAGGSGSGGKNSGGSMATGGSATGGNMTGGQSSGGSASGGSANGGNTSKGGTTGTGGSGSGGQATGGTATGGASATGGQGTGGKSSGGTVGSGGAATGGSTSATGGQTTGGTSAMGGATGGASGTGGSYHPCPTDGTVCKIMPFGDSITDGVNQSNDSPGGYRVELFKRAHADGKNITFVGSSSNGPDTVDGVAFPHNHEGHSGWTIYPEGWRDGISYCLSANNNNKCLATNSVMLEYKPNIVLLMIGTNDCIDNYDMANATTRLSTLIGTIYDQLPDVLIVVAQPIPSRGDASKNDDTGLSARLKTYGDAIPAVVKSWADKGKHISSVDMYTPFNPNKASLIDDQWHPNLAGYTLLGDQWYLVLKPLL